MTGSCSRVNMSHRLRTRRRNLVSWVLEVPRLPDLECGETAPRLRWGRRTRANARGDRTVSEVSNL